MEIQNRSLVWLFHIRQTFVRMATIFTPKLATEVLGPGELIGFQSSPASATYAPLPYLRNTEMKYPCILNQTLAQPMRSALKLGNALFVHSTSLKLDRGRTLACLRRWTRAPTFRRMSNIATHEAA